MSPGKVVNAAIAGAMAVWMMDRFDWFAFDQEDADARQLTEAVRPNGMDPAQALAEKAASASDISLKPSAPHRHPAGPTVHYAVPLGLAMAMCYASLSRRIPSAGEGNGALFGAATFVLLDEIINPIIGLAVPPDRYPWQRHVRELSAHILFGVVTHTVLQLFDDRRQLSNTKQSVQ